MKNTIKKVMDKEHERVEKILEEFENSLWNLKLAREIFNRFDWTLEKHFFIEEKIIFTIYNSSDGESEDLNELVKEHKEIIWEIKKIKDNLDRGVRPSIAKLKGIHKAHSKFEDEVFYPRLDDELSEDEKELIFERVEEVVRG
ncbi:hemerythrin domain-containing protein [archaeon]|nr:hemerythrin domain-containing protein [archaeon]